MSLEEFIEIVQNKIGRPIDALGQRDSLSGIANSSRVRPSYTQLSYYINDHHFVLLFSDCDNFDYYDVAHGVTIADIERVGWYHPKEMVKNDPFAPDLIASKFEWLIANPWEFLFASISTADCAYLVAILDQQLSADDFMRIFLEAIPSLTRNIHVASIYEAFRQTSVQITPIAERLGCIVEYQRIIENIRVIQKIL